MEYTWQIPRRATPSHDLQVVVIVALNRARHVQAPAPLATRSPRPYHSPSGQTVSSMPPHLRHGIPVDQRFPQAPKRFHLCTCWQCYSQTTINPVTSELEQGTFVPWNVYQRHLEEDTNRNIAPASALGFAVGLQSLISWIGAYILQHAPVKLGFPVEQPPPHPQPTDLESTVEGIYRQLPTMRSRAINHRRLVFTAPPTPTSLPTVFQGFGGCPTEINSGTYALDSSAPENVDLLAYEEWLAESLQHIERGKASRNLELKLRSAVVGKEVADALEAVDDIRAKEWERQRVLLNSEVADDSPSRTSTSAVSLSTSNWVD